jgi:hypothetical protein
MNLRVHLMMLSLALAFFIEYSTILTLKDTYVRDKS